MSENFRELLWLVSLGGAGGAAIGVAVRKLRPHWCRRYTKFANHKKWWIFLTSFLFWGFLAWVWFSEGNVPWGGFAGAFSLASLVCLICFGFKPLSPEMSRKIDEWDPTKFFGR